MNFSITSAQPKQAAKTALNNCVLAFFLFGLMIALALLTKGRGTPFVSIICLGFLSQRMRPRTVVGWSAIFALTVFLISLYMWRQGMVADCLTPYIRLGTIVAGGVGASFLSFNINRMEEGFLQTIDIFEKLPTPVIISDVDGLIVFMNNDALKLMDITAEEVQGTSYFSFVVAAEKGKKIQRYFDFVSFKQTSLHNFAIQVRKPTPMEIQTTLLVIQGKHARLVATVFPNLFTESAAVTKEDQLA